MPNIATVLKEEIARIARKVLRAETDSLKKASAQYRSDIAALKRRVSTLEQQLARAEKTAGKVVVEPRTAEPDQRVRFSAQGLSKLRQRLELSAPEMARLIGVSSQSIYNWESETTRPRQEQIVAIAELRSIGKRELQTRLAAVVESRADTGSAA